MRKSKRDPYTNPHGQKEIALYEDAAGRRVQATIERIEHGRRLKKMMQEKASSKGAKNE